MARKLAKAATLTAVLMNPVRDVFAAMENKYDLVEVACAPTSQLTQTFEGANYECLRVNQLTGYNLDTKKGTFELHQEMRRKPAKLAWISLPCTRLTALQNLTERDEIQMAKYQKRLGQDLRRSDEVAESMEPVLEAGGDYAWEWPTTAVKGWRSKAIRRLERLARKYNKVIYWIKIGCQYGMIWDDVPLKKSWTIMTTSKSLWLTLNKRCDGTHPHAECRGKAAQASSYYPKKMCEAVLKAMNYQWHSEDMGMIHLVEQHLLRLPQEDQMEIEDNVKVHDVMALSRTKLQTETAPTGKRLEAVKQMMMRVHRAAGHTGMSNLQRLLEARGSPRWAIELAGTLVCPECQEASRPGLKPPASTQEEHGLFEVLGTDIFEYEDDRNKKKYKGILWRDRASGLTMIEILHEYNGGERWEPTTQDIIKSLTGWLMHHPSPSWVITDAAPYFTSAEFAQYCWKSGLGLTVAPAEAHWLMGSEEQAIGLAKRAVAKMRREFDGYDIPTLFQLAAHAANSHVGSSGYFAYQWVHGRDPFTGDGLPDGLDASKAFSGLLKARDRIKIAYETEKAREKFSKLANAVTRPTMKCTTGQLVMLWRQKVKPGKVKGSWVGPLRVLLVEGSTVWLATGATLVRAKMNQIRQITKREEMTATLEGTAIIRTPVTVETLLRNFQGRNYLDVSGDVPSERQLREDLAPTEVSVPAASSTRSDSWFLKEDGGERTLVRIHRLPRLALFAPTRLTVCLVPLRDVTGKRTTVVRYSHGGDEVTIKDDWDVVRSLPDRWTGETHFELVKIERPTKSRRSAPTQGMKRKATTEAEEGGEELHRGQGELPGVDDASQEPTEQAGASGTLDQALQQQGPDVVDGLIPATPMVIEGASGSNQCPVPDCNLPGGHAGAHQGDGGRFLYDLYEGKKWIVDTEDDRPQPELPPRDETSSETSSSSEELLPEVREGEPGPLEEESEGETFLVCEMELNDRDLEWLAKHPKERKVNIWLSKKMSEKGKEVVWNQLPIAKKKEFDLAQAKELTQVAVSQALRRLTKEEEMKLNWNSVMQMRWVLTLKGDQTAKARLVGFQAPNLTSVETASPTMSRVGRNLILVAAATLGMKVKAGDVSSAFLQTTESLESEELTVWAPPELATFFGGDPRRQLPLRVLKAFYGLVHAPRKWFETVCNSLREHGWRQLIGDKCVFLLLEDGEADNQQKVVGIAGLHVDDFLLAGCETSVKYQEAEVKLQNAFRFGKWDDGENGFEFAGCHLKQNKDYSITLDQETYTNRWVDEIEIDPSRSKRAELTKQETSAVRAALGSVSWKATQTGPQYLAETSLFLSEVNRGTVDLMHRINRMIRDMKKAAAQKLLFPAWNMDLAELAVMTWSDASNHNRYDKSSTLGVLTGIGPKGALAGDEVQLALVQWKSGKCPRQCLGSNGAEVQAVTVGEDQNFQVRALLLELCGEVPDRDHLHDQVARVPGALIMDSRGIFDAATRNLSSLHGLRDSRAGYELTIAVSRAIRSLTQLRWVNGGAQLADSLTKADRKIMLQFLSQRQHWRLIYDDKFVSGRRLKKKALDQKLREMESEFVNWLKRLAHQNCWPWDEGPEIKYSALN